MATTQGERTPPIKAATAARTSEWVNDVLCRPGPREVYDDVMQHLESIATDENGRPVLPSGSAIAQGDGPSNAEDDPSGVSTQFRSLREHVEKSRARVRDSVLGKMAPSDCASHSGLRRATFEALGLPQEAQDRIHRALYVYSSGVHSLLQDITTQGHNKERDAEITTAVWTVFLQLLERSDPARNRTFFTELRRQYSRQVQVLRSLHEQEVVAVADQVSALQSAAAQSARAAIDMKQKLHVETASAQVLQRLQEAQLRGAEDTLVERDERIAELEAELQRTQNALEERDAELHEWKMRQAQTAKELKAQQQQNAMLAKTRERIQGEIGGVQDALAQTKKELNKVTTKWKQAVTDVKQFDWQVQQLQNDLMNTQRKAKRCQSGQLQAERELDRVREELREREQRFKEQSAVMLGQCKAMRATEEVIEGALRQVGHTMVLPSRERYRERIWSIVQRNAERRRRAVEEKEKEKEENDIANQDVALDKSEHTSLANDWQSISASSLSDDSDSDTDDTTAAGTDSDEEDEATDPPELFAVVLEATAKYDHRVSTIVSSLSWQCDPSEDYDPYAHASAQQLLSDAKDSVVYLMRMTGVLQGLSNDSKALAHARNVIERMNVSTVALQCGVSVWSGHGATLGDRLRWAKQRIHALTEESNHHHSEWMRCEDTMRSWQERINAVGAVEEECAELRKQNAETKSRTMKLVAQKNRFAEQNKSLQEDNTALQETVEQTQRRVQTLLHERSDLTKHVNNVETEAKKRVSDAALRTTITNRISTRLRNERDSLLAERASLTTRCSALQKRVDMADYLLHGSCVWLDALTQRLSPTERWLGFDLAGSLCARETEGSDKTRTGYSTINALRTFNLPPPVPGVVHPREHVARIGEILQSGLHYNIVSREIEQLAVQGLRTHRYASTASSSTPGSATGSMVGLSSPRASLDPMDGSQSSRSGTNDDDGSGEEEDGNMNSSTLKRGPAAAGVNSDGEDNTSDTSEDEEDDRAIDGDNQDAASTSSSTVSGLTMETANTAQRRMQPRINEQSRQQQRLIEDMRSLPGAIPTVPARLPLAQIAKHADRCFQRFCEGSTKHILVQRAVWPRFPSAIASGRDVTMSVRLAVKLARMERYIASIVEGAQSVASTIKESEHKLAVQIEAHAETRRRHEAAMATAKQIADDEIRALKLTIARLNKQMLSLNNTLIARDQSIKELRESAKDLTNDLAQTKETLNTTQRELHDSNNRALEWENCFLQEKARAEDALQTVTMTQQLLQSTKATASTRITALHQLVTRTVFLREAEQLRRARMVSAEVQCELIGALFDDSENDAEDETVGEDGQEQGTGKSLGSSTSLTRASKRQKRRRRHCQAEPTAAEVAIVPERTARWTQFGLEHTVARCAELAGVHFDSTSMSLGEESYSDTDSDSESSTSSNSSNSSSTSASPTTSSSSSDQRHEPASEGVVKGDTSENGAKKRGRSSRPRNGRVSMRDRWLTICSATAWRVYGASADEAGVPGIAAMECLRFAIEACASCGCKDRLVHVARSVFELAQSLLLAEDRCYATRKAARNAKAASARMAHNQSQSVTTDSIAASTDGEGMRVGVGTSSDGVGEGVGEGVAAGFDIGGEAKDSDDNRASGEGQEPTVEEASDTAAALAWWPIGTGKQPSTIGVALITSCLHAVMCGSSAGKARMVHASEVEFDSVAEGAGASTGGPMPAPLENLYDYVRGLVPLERGGGGSPPRPEADSDEEGNGDHASDEAAAVAHLVQEAFATLAEWPSQALQGTIASHIMLLLPLFCVSGSALRPVAPTDAKASAMYDPMMPEGYTRLDNVPKLQQPPKQHPVQTESSGQAVVDSACRSRKSGNSLLSNWPVAGSCTDPQLADAAPLMQLPKLWARDVPIRPEFDPVLNVASALAGVRADGSAEAASEGMGAITQNQPFSSSQVWARQQSFGVGANSGRRSMVGAAAQSKRGSIRNASVFAAAPFAPGGQVKQDERTRRMSQMAASYVLASLVAQANDVNAPQAAPPHTRARSSSQAQVSTTPTLGESGPRSHSASAVAVIPRVEAERELPHSPHNSGRKPTGLIGDFDEDDGDEDVDSGAGAVDEAAIEGGGGMLRRRRRGPRRISVLDAAVRELGDTATAEQQRPKTSSVAGLAGRASGRRTRSVEEILELTRPPTSPIVPSSRGSAKRATAGSAAEVSSRRTLGLGTTTTRSASGDPETDGERGNELANVNANANANDAAAGDASQRRGRILMTMGDESNPEDARVHQAVAFSSSSVEPPLSLVEQLPFADMTNRQRPQSMHTTVRFREPSSSGPGGANSSVHAEFMQNVERAAQETGIERPHSRSARSSRTTPTPLMRHRMVREQGSGKPPIHTFVAVGGATMQGGQHPYLVQELPWGSDSRVEEALEADARAQRWSQTKQHSQRLPSAPAGQTGAEAAEDLVPWRAEM